MRRSLLFVFTSAVLTLAVSGFGAEVAGASLHTISDMVPPAQGSAPINGVVRVTRSGTFDATSPATRFEVEGAATFRILGKTTSPEGRTYYPVRGVGTGLMREDYAGPVCTQWAVLPVTIEVTGEFDPLTCDLELMITEHHFGSGLSAALCAGIAASGPAPAGSITFAPLFFEGGQGPVHYSATGKESIELVGWLYEYDVTYLSVPDWDCYLPKVDTP